MTTIYLSSTYEDLKDYRKVVYDALRKSGYDVIAMEDYVAADQRPVDKCLADVSKADLYIGILAFRYGYVPPVAHGNPNQLSITELEFRHAESLKKPCLTFCVSENKAWPPMFDDARKAEDKGERVNRLRQYLLTEKLGSPFSEPYELACLVQAAVTKHIQENTTSTAVDVKKIETVWDVKKDGSPYPGLLHFTRHYASVFFGRDIEIGEIIDRMRGANGRFIIISGESGVGKSSVVDAGVLPRLENGSLPGGEKAVTVPMLPSQGADPFAALMTALGPYATRAGQRHADIAEMLKQAPEGLTDQLRRIVSGGLDGKPLVLFVNQMEELFAPKSLEASTGFLSALYRAAQDKVLWVIATIRADHLHFCHRHPDLLAVLNSQARYSLGPVEPHLLRDVIVRPAECAGLGVSDDLARRLIHDAGEDSADLPLLAFVLNRLVDQERMRLSAEAYRGIDGAIAEHAAKIETDLPAGHLDKLLPTLALVKEDGVPTRNYPLRSGFSLEIRSTVDKLVDARLLRSEGESEAAAVSIAHEKLFEAWPTLRAYVTANKKTLMDRSLLAARARKWLDMGKPWFVGLASRRERRDFSKAGVPTADLKSYLAASARAWWFQSVAAASAIVLLSVFALAWQAGWLPHHVLLKVAAIAGFKIHLEPDPKDMIEVKGDEFEMGDVWGRGDPDELPVHPVEVANFKISKYEVSFDEYDRFVLATGGSLPSDQNWGRGDRPVINVSWEEARDYAKWLSEQTGTKYRLLTEAEWEYAARSGGKKHLWSGTSDEKDLAQYAVFAKGRTEPTRSKRKPNELGIYDMSGNVWEWVEDCWHDNYNGAPTEGRAWKGENNGNCGQRVIRGGSWSTIPYDLRSSLRDWFLADTRSLYVGFRLAQDIK